MPKKPDTDKLADALSDAIDEFSDSGCKRGHLILVDRNDDERDMNAEVKAVIFLKTTHATAVECVSAVESILDRSSKPGAIPKKKDMH